MNLRPPACKADALPIELHPQEKMVGAAGFEPATSCSQSRSATRLRYAPNEIGGGERDRTDGLLHAMQALSQLSYTPQTFDDEIGKQNIEHRHKAKRLGRSLIRVSTESRVASDALLAAILSEGLRS